jgi:chorismate mutase
MTNNNDLIKFREEIDKIDKSIIELLKKRKDTAKKIGEYKKQNNLPIIDEKREKEILEKYKRIAEENDLDKEDIGIIFQAIIKNSRNVQK